MRNRVVGFRLTLFACIAHILLVSSRRKFPLLGKEENDGKEETKTSNSMDEYVRKL